MNCLILLVLLFCCGNSGYTNTTRCECKRESVREPSANCECRGRQETSCDSRIEPRTFISYQNSSCQNNACGCEEQRIDKDCDCR